MATIVRGKSRWRGWPAGAPVSPDSAPPAKARARARGCHPDTALLDWLDAFAARIERDDVLDRWTVHPAHDGMPRASGRSLRAAALAAMDASDATFVIVH